MYRRICSSSSPTVLTQYPRAQKLRPNNLPFVCNNSRWIRVALVPFRYPIVIAMLYRGGTLNSMWMGSGIAFPSTSSISFWRHRSRRIWPMPRRIRPYNTWRQRDSELLPDQLAQAWGGPQLGLEAMVQRALGQPAQGDLLLNRRQLPWPPRDRSGGKAMGSLVAEGGHPPAHGRGIDPKEVGDLLGRVSLGDTLHGEPTPMRQLVR